MPRWSLALEVRCLPGAAPPPRPAAWEHMASASGARRLSLRFAATSTGGFCFRGSGSGSVGRVGRILVPPENGLDLPYAEEDVFAGLGRGCDKKDRCVLVSLPWP